jgi:hypothetical protein
MKKKPKKENDGGGGSIVCEFCNQVKQIKG